MSEQLNDHTVKGSEGYNRKPRPLSSLSKFRVHKFNQKGPWYDQSLRFFISLVWSVKFGLAFCPSTMWGFANSTVKGFLLVEDA